MAQIPSLRNVPSVNASLISFKHQGLELAFLALLMLYLKPAHLVGIGSKDKDILIFGVKISTFVS
jgi:hypothetical protein